MSKENKKNYSKFPFTLDELKNIIKKYGTECFYSEEMMIKTKVANYTITKDLFNIKKYNEFIVAMANIIKTGKYSALLKIQPQKKHLLKTLDNYIRTKLFGEPFDPCINNNWQVLMIAKVGIIEHIIKEISQSIYGISIEKLIKIIKALKDAIIQKDETIIQQEKTIAQQEEFISKLQSEIPELLTKNSILKLELEKIKEEKLQIEAQRKTEKEQKIDEILKITKKIEGHINTQTIGSN